MSRLRANRASLEESFYLQFSMAQSTLPKNFQQFYHLYYTLPILGLFPIQSRDREQIGQPLLFSRMLVTGIKHTLKALESNCGHKYTTSWNLLIFCKCWVRKPFCSFYEG